MDLVYYGLRVGKSMYPKIPNFNLICNKIKITHICLILLLMLNISQISIIKSNENNQIESEKYAVIVVGRFAGRLRDLFPENFQKYYRWYLNAAGMMYSSLKENYNYKDENIFLLSSLRERYEMPDSFDASWVDFNSTKDNLKHIMNRFKPGGDIWLDSHDSLLFCYINHGSDEDSKNNGKFSHDTFFGFPYDFENMRDILSYFIFNKNKEPYTLYDWELASFCENLYAVKIIFLLQPCYSGGFINDLSGINRIICTASTEGETATESWIEPFIKGLNGDADTNDDKQISLLEAYEYAARKVLEKTSDEHPLLDDNADGIGHHFSEIGYNPSQPNVDGYLAGRTYL